MLNRSSTHRALVQLWSSRAPTTHAQMAARQQEHALGLVLAPFFWLLASSGRRLPGQGAAGCPKETSGVNVGTLWPLKAQIRGLRSLPRMFWFSWHVPIYFRAAAAFKFLSFAACVKNARMACDPQPMFCSWLFDAAWPGACHASKKKAKLKENT